MSPAVVWRPRAIACKAPRQSWQSRQRRHCGICNLQIPNALTEFESHPLRQQFQSNPLEKRTAAVTFSAALLSLYLAGHFRPRWEHAEPDRPTSPPADTPRGAIQRISRPNWTRRSRHALRVRSRISRVCSTTASSGNSKDLLQRKVDVLTDEATMSPFANTCDRPGVGVTSERRLQIQSKSVIWLA